MIAVAAIGAAAHRSTMSPSVPRTIRSSGHVARWTTATGHAAP
jgi:hypothetical protein